MRACVFVLAVYQILVFAILMCFNVFCHISKARHYELALNRIELNFIYFFFSFSTHDFSIASIVVHLIQLSLPLSFPHYFYRFSMLKMHAHVWWSMLYILFKLSNCVEYFYSFCSYLLQFWHMEFGFYFSVGIGIFTLFVFIWWACLNYLVFVRMEEKKKKTGAVS